MEETSVSESLLFVVDMILGQGIAFLVLIRGILLLMELASSLPDQLQDVRKDNV